MERREALKIIASVPLVATLVSVEAKASPSVPQANPLAYEEDFWLYSKECRAKMVAQLQKNLDTAAADYHVPWDPKELEYMKQACPVFIEHLLDGGMTTAHWVPDLFPGQDPRLLDKIRFEVWDRPVGVIRLKDDTLHPRETMRRKVRVRWSLEAMQDVTCGCFGGRTAEEETIYWLGKEIAEDIQMEIRSDIKYGNLVQVYAIYLPGHLLPVDPKMAAEFSIHRRPMIRYAKMAGR